MSDIEIIIVTTVAMGIGWFLGGLYTKSKELSERIRNNPGC